MKKILHFRNGEFFRSESGPQLLQARDDLFGLLSFQFHFKLDIGTQKWAVAILCPGNQVTQLMLFQNFFGSFHQLINFCGRRKNIEGLVGINQIKKMTHTLTSVVIEKHGPKHLVGELCQRKQLFIVDGPTGNVQKQVGTGTQSGEVLVRSQRELLVDSVSKFRIGCSKDKLPEKLRIKFNFQAQIVQISQSLPVLSLKRQFRVLQKWFGGVILFGKQVGLPFINKKICPDLGR